MTQTIQPSTIRNLEALTGDVHTAIAYGKDIADLLAEDDTVRPDEADLLAAATAPALIVAATRLTRSASPTGSAVFRELLTDGLIKGAADTVADAVMAVRGTDLPDLQELAALREVLAHAFVFQLTDIDEQD